MKRYVGTPVTWKDFPKYAGKDIWILVFSYDNSRFEYIKIVSIEPDFNGMVYNSIGADQVLHSIYEENYDWFLSCMFSDRFTKHPERFTVDLPLDIMTTEEIIDCLHTDMISE